MKDVQIMHKTEECAWDMAQRKYTNDAAVMDAQIKLRKGDCVWSMGQNSNDAAVKDVQTKSSKEECAWSMKKSSNDAAVMDAQITLRREEYALNTAFASCFGSEFEKTTVTHPGQLESGSSSNQAQGSLPAEVVVCGVITEDYEEV